ncbi:MAG: hypothetical protein WA152_01575 [Microgenomates group bacterium]
METRNITISLLDPNASEVDVNVYINNRKGGVGTPYSISFEVKESPGEGVIGSYVATQVIPSYGLKDGYMDTADALKHAIEIGASFEVVEAPTKAASTGSSADLFHHMVPVVIGDGDAEIIRYIIASNLDDYAEKKLSTG